MIKEPTDEQRAIFKAISSGGEHILVEALAGTGKTSTALEGLSYLPQKSALYCAFNKKIADELQAKLPPAPKGSFWKAQTFHSLGLKIVQSHARVQVKSEATEELVNKAAQRLCDEDDMLKVPFRARRAAVKLLRTLKETQTARELSESFILQFGYENENYAQLSSAEVDATVKVVRAAYTAGLDLDRRFSIDFCDMVWLPVVLNLSPPTRYQAVFVDEAQDLSLPQLTLVSMMVAPKGRLIVVGDRSQGIYSWRGAVGDKVWKVMLDEHKAKRMPLTTTFRCDRAIVKAANEIVPALRARPDAGDGLVRNILFKNIADELRGDDRTPTFVLSRNNADLLHTAMFLWRMKVPFELTAGTEIVDPLFDIIDKLDKGSKDRFRAGLQTHLATEKARAESVHSTAYADRVESEYAMLMMMLDYAEPNQLRGVLQSILKGVFSNVTLSTVHKVKGLEADRVFLLEHTFARHRFRAQIEAARKLGDDGRVAWLRDRLASIPQEELNLEYVAITRAKHELVWVDTTENASFLVRLLDSEKRKGKRGEIVKTFDGGLALQRDGDSVRVDPSDLSPERLAEAEAAMSDDDEEVEEP